MPPNAHVIMYPLLLFTTLVFAVTLADMAILFQKERHGVNDTKLTILVAFVQLTSLMVWPLVWYLVIYTNSRGESKFKDAHLLSLLWPLLLFLMDMSQTHKIRKVGFQFESLYRYTYFQTTAGTLIAAAFAIGTLMGNSLEGNAKQAIVTSILICVLALIPTSPSPITSRNAVVFRYMQKTCLIYSIGLFTSGLIYAVMQA